MVSEPIRLSPCKLQLNCKNIRVQEKWIKSSSCWFSVRHQGPGLLCIPIGIGAGRKCSISHI